MCWPVRRCRSGCMHVSSRPLGAPTESARRRSVRRRTTYVAMPSWRAYARSRWSTDARKAAGLRNSRTASVLEGPEDELAHACRPLIRGRKQFLRGQEAAIQRRRDRLDDVVRLRSRLGCVQRAAGGRGEANAMQRHHLVRSLPRLSNMDNPPAADLELNTAGGWSLPDCAWRGGRCRPRHARSAGRDRSQGRGLDIGG